MTVKISPRHGIELPTPNQTRQRGLENSQAQNHLKQGGKYSYNVGNHCSNSRFFKKPPLKYIVFLLLFQNQKQKHPTLLSVALGKMHPRTALKIGDYLCKLPSPCIFIQN